MTDLTDLTPRAAAAKIYAEEIAPTLDLPENLTPSQRREIKRVLEYVILSDFFLRVPDAVAGRTYEFKRLEIEAPEHLQYVSKWVFITTEVGRVGDEGTLGEVFGRTARMYMVGKRGGLRSVNKNGDWEKGPRTIYNRMR